MYDFRLVPGFAIPDAADTVVIGIDPSSVKFAVTVATMDQLKFGMFTLTLRKGRNARDKIAACMDAFELGEWLGSTYPNTLLVALEAPVLGRGGAGATIPQCYTSGALQAGLGRSGHESSIDLAVNSHWKKVSTGNGGAGKDEIAEWVKLAHRPWFDAAKLPRGGVDQDLCDAIGILEYGINYVRTQHRLYRASIKSPLLPVEGNNDATVRAAAARVRNHRSAQTSAQAARNGSISRAQIRRIAEAASSEAGQAGRGTGARVVRPPARRRKSVG